MLQFTLEDRSFFIPPIIVDVKMGEIWMTHKHHITAIICDKKGRVLSVGQNSYIDSIRLQRKHANKVGLPEKKFNHGEIVAIAKCRDLSKAHTIKVMRYTKDGKPANAKPCLVCMSAIAESGIKNIEYTVGEE